MKKIFIFIAALGEKISNLLNSTKRRTKNVGVNLDKRIKTPSSRKMLLALFAFAIVDLTIGMIFFSQVYTLYMVLFHIFLACAIWFMSQLIETLTNMYGKSIMMGISDSANTLYKYVTQKKIIIAEENPNPDPKDDPKEIKIYNSETGQWEPTNTNQN